MSSAKRTIEEDLESRCMECGNEWDSCECYEQIEIELPTKLFVDLSLEAHNFGITFNEYIMRVLRMFIRNLGESNDSKNQEK
jgi:hypothetical protein